MQAMTTKLCIDCKHCERGEGFQPPTCHALDGKPSPMNGKPNDGYYCEFMRLGPCGWDFPRLWEPKIEKAK